MKVKTQSLIGPALDWAVAKASGVRTYISRYEHTMTGVCILDADLVDMDTDGQQELKYSRDWHQGGLIINQEISELYEHKQLECWAAKSKAGDVRYGPTILIAAMRCYLASKLGDEVEVPDELLREL